MRCATCKEASSKQLPVSEVCKHCHNYSHYIPARIVLPQNIYTVRLYLHRFKNGEDRISLSRRITDKGERVVSIKQITVNFGEIHELHQ